MQFVEPALLGLALLLLAWRLSRRKRWVIYGLVALGGVLSWLAMPAIQDDFSVPNGGDSFLVQRWVLDTSDGYQQVAMGTRWLFPLPRWAGHRFARAPDGHRLVVTLRPGPVIEVEAISLDGRPSGLVCADHTVWGVPVRVEGPSVKSCS